MTAIIETGRTGPHNQYKNNLVYGGNTNISLANGLQATGTVKADPQFVNNTGNASGNYRVQMTSPARGTGLALAGVLTDFDGVSRPQAGMTVIGAALGTSPTSGAGSGSSGAATATISASPTSVTSGQSSVISWTSSNGVSAKLNGASVALNGSTTVNPTATTTYTIAVADSSGKTTSQSVSVAVNAPTSGTVAAGVMASPTSIKSGQSSVITWDTRNAVSATLNGKAVALNGSMTVQPTATTQYKVVGTASNGSTDWGSVTVTVAAATTSGPVAAGASASPTSIASGQTSVISWHTTNAVSATLNGAAVALNGSVSVRPTATTVYKIVATDANGKTDWGSATVTVK